jgi:hypothetical protein
VVFGKFPKKVLSKFPGKLSPIKRFFSYLGRFVRNIVYLVFYQKSEPKTQVSTYSRHIYEAEALKSSSMINKYSR